MSNAKFHRNCSPITNLPFGEDHWQTAYDCILNKIITLKWDHWSAPSNSPHKDLSCLIRQLVYVLNKSIILLVSIINYVDEAVYNELSHGWLAIVQWYNLNLCMRSSMTSIIWGSGDLTPILLLVTTNNASSSKQIYQVNMVK